MTIIPSDASIGPNASNSLENFKGTLLSDVQRVFLNLLSLLLFLIVAHPLHAQHRPSPMTADAEIYHQIPSLRYKPLSQLEENIAKLNEPISIRFSEASLEQALKLVSERAGLRVIYGDRPELKEKHVSLILEDVTILAALYEIIRGTPLGLKLAPSGHIIVVDQEVSIPNAHPVLEQKVGTITGTVTDSLNGNPIPGVNVVIASTQQGAATDADGQYTISGVEPGIYTLQASFVGYLPKTVEGVEVVDGQTTEVNIALAQSAILLDEVVAIGYGEQLRRDITGSVASITADEFNQGVITSPGQLLQGKVSGAEITQTTGEPGGGISIRIRGATSINADNEPLYVIDGYPIDNSPTLGATAGGTGLGADQSPRDPLSTLNPEDIESIQILKDASATAIYGSRGANGVVLITTKKGRLNDFQLDYSMSTGFQSVADRIDVLSTQEYIAFINGVSVESGGEPVFSQADIARIGAGTDWQDEIFRTAGVNNHALAFSGGSATTTYRGSLNYLNQQGIVKNTGIERYTGRLNLQNNFRDGKGNIGINLTASLIDNSNSTENLTINEGGGPFNSALLYDPTEPVYNEDGSFNRSTNLTIDNPLAKVEGVDSEGRDTRTLGNAFLEYNFTEHLSAKLNFGFDLINSKVDLFNSSATITGDGANGIANIRVLERTNLLAEYTMRYDRQLNENHSFDLLGGFTFEEFNTETFSGNISNFLIEQLGPHNLNLGDTGFDGLTSFKSINRLISYFGRTNYQFMDKYLLTATIRADGSSRFGANNKFGVFPSFALGWRLSEEDFVPDFFNDLKLRVSYGETGNQEIGNDLFLPTFVPAGNVAFGNDVANTLAPTRIANPDLKWETSKQFDVGVDLSILDARITGSLDWFLKKTEDILLNRPLPPASGFSSRIENVGSVENTGVELQLNIQNVRSTNLFWVTSLNVSYLQNEVTDMGGLGQILTGNLQDVGNTALFREGDPVGAYFGFEVEGIFQSAQEVASSAQPEAIPGHVRFKDQNGDGTINAADRVVIGNPNPDWILGISNSLILGNFNFSMFWQGQLGAQLLNQNRLQSSLPTNFRRNRISEQTLDRWTVDNPDAKWPSGVNPAANMGGRELNTLYLDDASYIRLKSVRLGYNIPMNLIRSASIYITGENLLTITDYIGSNPEANALGRSNIRVDMSSFPLARSFTLGVNLGF